MAKNNFQPTESELEILKIMWELGTCTVREVHEKLQLTKSSGYTTTLKLMQIMTEKGIIGRHREKKSHLYFAKFEEGETKNNLIKNFLRNVFDGSTSQLVLQALGNNKTSKEELDKIKNLIDDLEKDRD